MRRAGPSRPVMTVLVDEHQAAVDLVRGLRRAVENDATEWVDASIIRLLLANHAATTISGKGSCGPCTVADHMGCLGDCSCAYCADARGSS